MFKFILSFFISKDKALELIEEHEEKITEFSQKNEHVATAVKTGFKIWSIWKTILLIWWWFLMILVLVCGYFIYTLVSKFI